VRAHRGEQTVQCTHCDLKKKHIMALMDEKSYDSHLKLKHAEENTYECPLCDYTCTSKCTFKMHFRIHFTDKKSLETNIEKNHECSICTYKCITKYQMDNHNRTHTGEKPYHCAECNFRCSDQSYFKDHIGRHDSSLVYSCPDCDYKGKSKRDLNAHLHTHSKEKPYVCTECNSKFKSRSYLNKHINRHKRANDSSDNTGSRVSKRNKGINIKNDVETTELDIFTIYKCCYCDYVTHENRNLKHHIFQEHADCPIVQNTISKKLS